jgi:hypothetical protein
MTIMKSWEQKEKNQILLHDYSFLVNLTEICTAYLHQFCFILYPVCSILLSVLIMVFSEPPHRQPSAPLASVRQDFLRVVVYACHPNIDTFLSGSSPKTEATHSFESKYTAFQRRKSFS